MTAVLVSGAERQVDRVATALRETGADVTAVTDLDDMPSVCKEAGDGAFDAYVQLSSTFELRGETVIERVRAFYADGVLARFPAMAAAVPTLRPDAKVVFVLGQLPAEVASKDDRDARLSLTKVLAHAARADAPDTAYEVQVLDFETPLEQVVRAATGAATDPGVLLESLSGLTYADWRVEVLGLVALDT